MQATRHDNVVEVLEARKSADRTIVRMAFIEGGSVLDASHGHPLPVAMALTTIEDACRGIGHLHAMGVAHRDIKPGNLLRSRDGSVKVSDFGLARQFARPTPLDVNYVPHLAPEILKGADEATDAAHDIYSLGVTSYRLLNGEVVFERTLQEAADLEAAIARGRFPDRKRWLPHVHAKLRRAVLKAMHVDPRKRFATPSEFRHAIEQARPAVSWTCSQTPGVMQWNGRSATTGFAWKADLTVIAGKYRFEVRRETKTGRMLKVAKYSFVGSDVGGAFSTAENALEAVAVNDA